MSPFSFLSFSDQKHDFLATLKKNLDVIIAVLYVIRELPV